MHTAAPNARRRSPVVAAGTIAVAVALAATLAAVSDAPEVVMLPSVAPAGSMTGNLAASDDGVYLSWLEPEDDGHALRFARWDGSTFTEPRTIHRSTEFFANWADFSSMLVLADGRLVTHWLEKAAAGTYEYDVWMAISADGGLTWGEPARPHTDGTLSEHGFVSMVPDERGGFAAVWLDGRKFGDTSTANEMSLAFTTHRDGRFTPETILDDRVCECCQTTMTATSDGLFVAYRDRSAEEIRDIAYVRQSGGAWTAPRTVHDDGWQINGCPVNGPQAAADGSRVAVAWFTAAGDDARVRVAVSDDAGATFGQPTRIDEGRPLGRVGLIADGDGFVVSWLERRTDPTGRADVRLRHLSASGEPGPPITIAQTGSGRSSGFARMAAHGGHVYVSWTETSGGERPSRVRMARVSLAALGR